MTWVYLYSGLVELHNTGVSYQGVHVTWLYLHSGVVGVHITRFDEQGVVYLHCGVEGLWNTWVY